MLHQYDLLACVKKYCQSAGVKMKTDKTKVTGYDYTWKCSSDNKTFHRDKTVMLWDPIKYQVNST